MGLSDHLFRKAGLGYVLELPGIFTTLNIDHVYRSRGEVHATLTVKSAWPGAKTYSGVMYAASLSVASGTARKSAAKLLEERCPAADPRDQLDWYGFLEELCQGVLAAERDGGSVEDIGDNEDVARPPALLHPLLDRNQATILYGDSGTGKTMTALGMAVSVKTCKPIIPGFFPTIEPTEVLLLDWETSADEADRRVKAICAGAGIPRVRLHYLRCYAPLHESIEAIARAVAEKNIGLVIVDHAGSAMGHSRDGGDPAEPAMRLFGALRIIDTTSLIIDHVGKPQNGAPVGQTKPYGSSYKAHLARATWELRQAREPTDETAHIAIYHQKHNNTRKYPSMGFAMQASDSVVRWLSEEIYDAELAEAMNNADRIASALRSHPLRVREIANLSGLSENLVRSELNRLRGRRFEKIHTGDWSIIDGGLLETEET